MSLYSLTPSFHRRGQQTRTNLLSPERFEAWIRPAYVGFVQWTRNEVFCFTEFIRELSVRVYVCQIVSYYNNCKRINNNITQFRSCAVTHVYLSIYFDACVRFMLLQLLLVLFFKLLLSLHQIAAFPMKSSELMCIIHTWHGRVYNSYINDNSTCSNTKINFNASIIHECLNIFSDWFWIFFQFFNRTRRSCTHTHQINPTGYNCRIIRHRTYIIIMCWILSLFSIAWRGMAWHGMTWLDMLCV